MDALLEVPEGKLRELITLIEDAKSANREYDRFAESAEEAAEASRDACQKVRDWLEENGWPELRQTRDSINVSLTKKERWTILHALDKRSVHEGQGSMVHALYGRFLELVPGYECGKK